MEIVHSAQLHHSTNIQPSFIEISCLFAKNVFIDGHKTSDRDIE